MIDRKHYWVCMVFSLILLQPVLAQDSLSMEEYYPKPIVTSIEFLFGPSIVSLRGENQEAQYTGGDSYFVNTLENKIAYSLGVGLNHNFNNYFQISSRILWDRKGYVEKLDSVTLTTSGGLGSITPIKSENVINDYLTLSILPQFTFGNKGHFSIAAGGYVGLLLSSKTEYSGQTIFSYPSEQAYNKYDFGLSFNAGFSYPLTGKLDITAQVLANYGLHQISDWFVSFSYPPWYNSSYSVLIGVRFLNSKRKL